MVLDAAAEQIICAYKRHASAIVPFVCQLNDIDANVKVTESARSIDFTFRTVINKSNDLLELSIDFEVIGLKTPYIEILLSFVLTNGQIIKELSGVEAEVGEGKSLVLNRLLADALSFLRESAASIRNASSSF